MKHACSRYGFLVSFLLVSFLLGAWQQEKYPFHVWTIVCGVMMTGVIARVLLKKETMGWTLITVSLGCALAFFRVSMTVHEVTERDIAFHTGTKREMVGIVTDNSDLRQTSVRYEIAVENVKVEGKEYSVQGSVLASDYSSWPVYKPGDRVKFSGDIRIPEKVENFDYAKFLKSRGIDALVPRAYLSKTEEQPRPGIFLGLMRTLSGVREWFEMRVRLVQIEPEATLLIGLLTGSQGTTSEEISTAFRTAGLTHIVAISGSNITVILSVLSAAFFFIPIRSRALVLGIGITLFCLLVGADAPVVRATIMGVLGLIAIQAERHTMPRLLILWTGVGMVLWNPLQIWYDAGFQLSFLATLGISELGSYFKKWLGWITDTLGVRESLATTLAAQVATLPVSVLVFRQFSLISPLSNLLAAPLIPIAMLLGFVSTMVGIVVYPLGLLIGYFAWAVLALIIKIAEISAAVPNASIHF